jgi:hypothetical protein
MTREERPAVEAPPGLGLPEPVTPKSAEPAWDDAMIEHGRQAYQRDLPELARQRPGQWVAYHGARQVGFAPSRAELWQQCLEQGLPEGEFWVFSIEPVVGDEVIGFGAYFVEERPAGRPILSPANDLGAPFVSSGAGHDE